MSARVELTFDCQLDINCATTFDTALRSADWMVVLNRDMMLATGVVEQVARLWRSTVEKGEVGTRKST